MRILDTDTCVFLLRGNQRVLERRAAAPGEVCTTWITAGELYFGAARSADPAGNALLVTRFLHTLAVLDPTLGSARALGEAKALLRGRGTPVADADLLIASIALSLGAIVVTGNRRHFEVVPGLQVEDWIR